MTDHPITPPPELVQQWYDNIGPDPGPFESFAIAAARWGADQELEACAQWIYKLLDRGLEWSMDLRAARRPKPPSLKQQALDALGGLEKRCDLQCNLAAIRRALEQIDD